MKNKKIQSVWISYEKIKKLFEFHKLLLLNIFHFQYEFSWLPDVIKKMKH